MSVTVHRIHISDLPFYHFLMLHHTLGPKRRTRRLTRKARYAYRKHSGLIELLNPEPTEDLEDLKHGEDYYSHTIEQLYDRLVEKISLGGPSATKITHLREPLAFLKALTEVIEAGCVRITLSKFSRPRQVEQEFLGSISHPKE